MTKTKNERITTLENEVAELKLIVHELRGKKSIEPSTSTVEDIIEFEGQQYRKVDRVAREGDVVISSAMTSFLVEKGKPYKVSCFGRDLVLNKETSNIVALYNVGRTPETVNVYELIKPKPLTQNQQRAEIIEKAKKFVEKVSSRQSSWTVNENGNETYQQKCTFNEFIINNEKRTVVVLVKGKDSGKIFEKGIAKCNPSDVFNEFIGKAIALGRALGLDVSEFEQAVQPDKPVIGMMFVGCEGDVREIAPRGHYSELSMKSAIDSEYVEDCPIQIINDTNAKYEEG